MCRGHIGVVRLLLQHDANVNVVSELKDTSLHSAARCPDVHVRSDIFSLLVDAGAGNCHARSHGQRDNLVYYTEHLRTR